MIWVQWRVLGTTGNEKDAVLIVAFERMTVCSTWKSLIFSMCQGVVNMSYMGKDTPLFLRAIKVPTRQMHLHILDIRFKDTAPDLSEFIDTFKKEYGVAILHSAKGTKEVRDYADSIKFSFKDTNMIHIHANMLESIGDTIKMMYSDDQTGIVIPENHLLMQALLFEKKI